MRSRLPGHGRMDIYYFHLTDGEDVILDPEGRALPSQRSVIATALFEARAIMAADARGGTLRLDQSIQVEDEQGKMVHRLSFSDAIRITGGERRGSGDSLAGLSPAA